jgi:NitT/TauT family transport system substrate-binding protein
MKMNSSRLPFRLLIALILAGVQAGSAQEKPLPLRLTMQVSLNKLIFVVAAEEGIYKKNGLDVQQFLTQTTSDGAKRTGIQVPAQYVGKSDPSDPITIGGGGVEIVTMVTNARAPKHVILATTDDMANYSLIARKDITKPEQLKGKRIGYSSYGTTSHYQALLFVKKMGWNPDLEVSLLSNAMDVDTLQKGAVDAFVGDELSTTMATAAGYRPLVEFWQWKIPMAGNGVNVDRAWLENNRETARRFIKSMVEAIALMKQNKEIAFRSMAKYYGITDRQRQEAFYAPMENLPRKPYPAVAGIKKTMEVFDLHEMRQHKAEDFYDDSFVRELDRSGFIDSLYK